MFFRFGASLSLVVVVALAGTSLETRNLQLKRAISHQQYRRDALLDLHVRLRLEAQRLGTPAKLLGPLESGELSLSRPAKLNGKDRRQSQDLKWSARPRSVNPQ